MTVNQLRNRRARSLHVENVQEVLIQPSTGKEITGDQGKLISEKNSEDR